MLSYIEEAAIDDVSMELLLLADPSEERIRSYIKRSRCFVIYADNNAVGACIVQALGMNLYEIMNIAVQSAWQRRGYGTALLKWVVEFLKKSGACRIEVGTGAFGYQLAFYQKHGFRVTAIDRDFFVDNYPDPIVENGIRHLDLLRLTLRLPVVFY